MYDLIIKNAKIADGSGNKMYDADIAIKDGKIAKIAEGLDGANQVIDAKGLVASPGFIDPHSHVGDHIFAFPELKEKLEQGITTTITGCCGASIAPRPLSWPPKEGRYRTMGDALLALSKMEFGPNVSSLIGQGGIKVCAMNYETRKPTEAELETMRFYAREAMENGALGMSLGLFYVPGSFSSIEEITEVGKVIKEFDGVISAHIRDEGNKLIESVQEFIDIIKACGAKGVISHHKAMEKRNFGKVNETLKMIDDANREGCDIYVDVYPYTASSTTLADRFLPKEYRLNIKESLSDKATRQKIKEINTEACGRDDLEFALIINGDEYPEYIGKTIAEIAREEGKEDYDALFDILSKTEKPIHGCYFSMCEDDVRTVIKHPRAMICTDSGVVGNQKVVHPRLMASFTKALGKYVREEKLVPLEEMIRKITALPADVYGITNKGHLLEGYDADICIFDPQTISDKCDYTNCKASNEGLSYVIVGGKIAVKDNVFTGEKNGRAFLKQTK